jgi:hypothetical protein
VERDAKSGKIKLLSGEKAVLSTQEQEKFVRRLREPPKLLDLLDIVAGGNGLGNRRERGIDPTTGRVFFALPTGRRIGNNQYWPVIWHRSIDGVFIPDGRAGAVQIDSAGHTFQGFTETSGHAYGAIWSRAADAPFEHTENADCWMYTLGRPQALMPEGRGLLGMHANVGITFDLEQMRKMYRDIRPERFRTIAGVADARHVIPEVDGSADLWVFVDGSLKWRRTELRPRDGALVVDVALGPMDRFLTLATTDGGRERCCPWAVFGDPVIQLSDTTPTNKAEDRPMQQ